MIPEIPPILVKTILKYFPEGLTTIDLETTGLSPLSNEIIEAAGVKICADGTVSQFEQLIKPKIPITSQSTAIHKITNPMVADAYGIEEVLPDFLEFLDTKNIMAHNALFDLGFMVKAMTEQNLRNDSWQVFCSMRLAKSYAKKTKNHRLITLANFFGVDLTGHHRALNDALACTEVVGQVLQTIPFETKVSEVTKRSLLFNMKGWNNGDCFKFPKSLDGLQELVLQQTPCKMRYLGGNTENRGIMRPIRPISLLPHPKGAVLHAYCFLSHHFKSFMLKKIKTFELLEGEELNKCLEEEHRKLKIGRQQP
jgi:DNA polymerase-3 subunit epsilon